LHEFENLTRRHCAQRAKDVNELHAGFLIHRLCTM
jgi:hypothetical protein